MLESQHGWQPEAKRCYPGSSVVRSFQAQSHSIPTHFIPCTLLFEVRDRILQKTFWILCVHSTIFSVCYSPDSAIYGSPGLLHAIPKPEKMALSARRKRQPWCFSLVQSSAGSFIIPTHTHFAVSHISSTGFPLAEAVDTVGLKLLTYCTEARALCKQRTSDL